MVRLGSALDITTNMCSCDLEAVKLLHAWAKVASWQGRSALRRWQPLGIHSATSYPQWGRRRRSPCSPCVCDEAQGWSRPSESCGRHATFDQPVVGDVCIWITVSSGEPSAQCFIDLLPPCLSVIRDLPPSDARRQKHEVFSMITHRPEVCEPPWWLRSSYSCPTTVCVARAPACTSNVESRFDRVTLCSHAMLTWATRSRDARTRGWDVTCWLNTGWDAHHSARGKEWSCMTCTFTEARSLTFYPADEWVTAQMPKVPLWLWMEPETKSLQRRVDTFKEKKPSIYCIIITFLCYSPFKSLSPKDKGVNLSAPFNARAPWMC